MILGPGSTPLWINQSIGVGGVFFRNAATMFAQYCWYQMYFFEISSMVNPRHSNTQQHLPGNVGPTKSYYIGCHKARARNATSRLKIDRKMLRRGTTITPCLFEDILSSLNPQHFVEMQHVLNVTYISSRISILK